MKYILFILAFTIAVAGKSQNADTTKPTVRRGPSAEGVVSHKYKECGTVILVYNKHANDTIVLIPMGSSLGEFDVEGKKISFNYRNLMIKNPEGCMHGGPVILSNIKEVVVPHHKSKKKKTTGS
jgi:hypothetical protein